MYYNGLDLAKTSSLSSMHPFAQKKQGENQYTYYIENSNFACMTREDYLWQKENLGLDSHQLFNYKGTAK